MVISICQNVFVYFRKYLGSHVSVSHELLIVVHEGRRYITIKAFETKKKILVWVQFAFFFFKSVLTTVLNFFIKITSEMSQRHRNDRRIRTSDTLVNN